MRRARLSFGRCESRALAACTAERLSPRNADSLVRPALLRIKRAASGGPSLGEETPKGGHRLDSLDRLPRRVKTSKIQ